MGTPNRIVGLCGPTLAKSNLRKGRTVAVALFLLLSFYWSLRATQQVSNASDSRFHFSGDALQLGLDNTTFRWFHDHRKYVPLLDPLSPRIGGERPVQVLYGLHGQTRGFIDQWEVGIKSVLLNAPLDRPLHVHLVVDEQAEEAVRERLIKRAGVPTFRTRQPVTITVHNAEELTRDWTTNLKLKFRGKELDGAYAMGVYYRLLAHRIILPYWKRTHPNITPIRGDDRMAPGDVLLNHQSHTGGEAMINPILYLDADAVVLASLNDLWRNVAEDAADETPYNSEGIAEFVATARAAQNRTNPAEGRKGTRPEHGFLPILSNRSALANLTRTPVWQWSSTWPNSGFCIYYLQRMEAFWELLEALPSIPHTGDQTLLGYIAEAFPGIAGVLPREWDVHMGHGWRPAPHTILKHQRGRVGMAHFTGLPPNGKSYLDETGVVKYCDRSAKCRAVAKNKDDYMRTWGLVDYYVRIPWEYVAYFCESKIPIGEIGHRASVEVIRHHLGGEMNISSLLP